MAQIPQYNPSKYDHPFGMLMPGRSYSSNTYRYGGAGGQEKDNEIAGEGNITTAKYWEYDTRLGRRWNVDPVTFPWQSSYATFNNNPILFVDPLGLYGSEKRAQKMHDRAEKAGLNPSPVYQQSDKDENGNITKKYKSWGFNTTENGATVGNFDKRYFGSVSQKAGDLLSDINPVKHSEGYINWNIKSEKTVGDGLVKIVVPLTGQQASYSSKTGLKYDPISALNMYVNLKMGNSDLRLIPFKGAIGGDYDPGLRWLITLGSTPVVVDIGGLPVPIGDAKVQVDLQSSGVTRNSIGSRTTLETYPIPIGWGVNLKGEVTAGYRLVLKVPSMFKKDE